MFYWTCSIVTHSYTFLGYDTLEHYVHSAAFDKECAVIGKGPPSDDSNAGCSYHTSL